MGDSRKPTVVLVCDVPEGNLVRAGLSAKLQMQLDLKVVDHCNKAAAAAVAAEARYILVSRDKAKHGLTALYERRPSDTVRIFSGWKHAVEIITRLCAPTPQL